MQDQTMQERRKAARSRSLLQGKILINDRHSVIDCVVRNLSEHGACLRVASLVGIPPAFELQIGDETSTRQCIAIWHSDTRIGVEFRSQKPDRLGPGEEAAPAVEPEHNTAPTHAASTDLVRGELLSLRTALYEVPYGVVLLDNELRAQFINRA